MSRRFDVVATAVIVVVTTAALTRLARSEPVADLQPVASVNARPISQRELQTRLGELLPMASFHGNVSPEKLAALKRAALDELVLDELIVQQARRDRVEPDPRQVERQVAALRSRFPSTEAFENALRAAGLTPQAFRSHVERAVLVRQAKAAQAPPTPTEADTASYFEQHAAKFVRPEQVHLRVITIAVDPAGGRPAERQAEVRTAAVTGRLRQGAAFGQLAWDESADAYRVKYGDVGWVHRGRLDPDLEAAAFAAPLRQVRTVRSLSGFHVFEVVAREPERQLSFDEARPLILERLTRERREAAERAWHDRLRATARIVVLDPVLASTRPAHIPRDGGPLQWETGSRTTVARPAH